MDCKLCARNVAAGQRPVHKGFPSQDEVDLKMTKSATSSSSGGIGFVGLLTILFVALKLTEHIDWSWWWVLSPMWVTALLVVLIALNSFGLIRFWR